MSTMNPVVLMIIHLISINNKNYYVEFVVNAKYEATITSAFKAVETMLNTIIINDSDKNIRFKRMPNFMIHNIYTMANPDSDDNDDSDEE